MFADLFLAQRQHLFGRVGDFEQGIFVALLTPASVACADSATATTSVNGLTWASSPFGSGRWIENRRKISDISAFV